jgi:alpha-ketoglutarate-dependent taurine dioxygenase
MSLTLRALHPLFGVEVLGVDVRHVDDDHTFAEIVSAFNDHSVLLFRGQTLSDEEQIAFSERFGPLEVTIRSIAYQAGTPPEISNLSNVDAEDRLIPRGDKRNIFNAGRGWPRSCAQDGHSWPLGPEYRRTRSRSWKLT